MHRRSYILMTALPPTIGHGALIEYAAQLSFNTTVVLVMQPDEPYQRERVESLSRFLRALETRMGVAEGRYTLEVINQYLPQEPTPEIEAQFWDMWAEFLVRFGAQTGDAIVASERYGVKLAEIVGATFYPFDMNRHLVHAKATQVRKNPLLNFRLMLPEFRSYLRKRVTIFGAESTGKTSLTTSLSRNGRFSEWARPYLEIPEIGPEVTEEKMHAIWHGQAALQRLSYTSTAVVNNSRVVFDTDLFSTLGYWRMDKNLGEPPAGLAGEATLLKSDLYILTKSNIPFTPDPLRYGGDKRESDDQYWIDILEEFNLNYVVLESSNHLDRVDEADYHITQLFTDDIEKLQYQRRGSEYGVVDNVTVP